MESSSHLSQSPVKFCVVKYTSILFIGYTYYTFELIHINIYYQNATSSGDLVDWIKVSTAESLITGGLNSSGKKNIQISRVFFGNQTDLQYCINVLQVQIKRKLSLLYRLLKNLLPGRSQSSKWPHCSLFPSGSSQLGAGWGCTACSGPLLGEMVLWACSLEEDCEKMGEEK